jgi:hypothetical protein
MDVISAGSNGRHLNTLEKYHIYKISREDLHMNDKYKHTFQILHELYNSSIEPHKRYIIRNT